MPNAKKESYCGLVCSACAIYLASQEDESLLATTAEKMKQSIEATKCNGCKSDRVSAHCLQCKMRICAKNKNVDCCSECLEYPCAILQAFQSSMPRRSEQRKSLKHVEAQDYEAWYQDLLAGGYSLKKRGIAPEKDLIRKHLDKIKKYFGLSN